MNTTAVKETLATLLKRDTLETWRTMLASKNWSASVEELAPGQFANLSTEEKGYVLGVFFVELSNAYDRTKASADYRIERRFGTVKFFNRRDEAFATFNSTSAKEVNMLLEALQNAGNTVFDQTEHRWL